MVPDTFTNYFIASVGASAALIGLLFVAVTVAPERVFGSESTLERRAMAGSAFLALLNAFFISLAALIPGANIGYVAVIISIFALVNTLSVGWRIWVAWRHAHNADGLVLTVGSIAVYSDEIRYAAPLLQHGRDTSALYGLVYLILAIYGIGVARSWTLLGGGTDGVLALLGFRGSRQADRTSHSETRESAGQAALERGSRQADRISQPETAQPAPLAEGRPTVE